MKNISVNLCDKGYKILIGYDLLKQAGKLLNDCGFNDKLIIISSPVIMELYGNKLGRIAWLNILY